MLFHRDTFRSLHARWLALSVVAFAASAAAYVWEWRTLGALPGGGSRVGLTLGVVAGVICLFELALVGRKTRWFRARRRILGIPVGSAKAWMAAHIWLGLLAVPLVFMHSGFQFGGPLTTALAWFFAVVIASGVAGLALQNVLPRLITDAIPEETIYSQIDNVGRQFALDAVRLAQRYAGPGPRGLWDDFETQSGTFGGSADPTWSDNSRASDSRASDSGAGQSNAARPRTRDALVVGAPRRVGTIVTPTPQGELERPLAAEAPELHAALRERVVAFLSTGRSESADFSSVDRIRWYFDDLRRRVVRDVAPAIDQIEALCLQRRQLQRQKTLHVALHCWLSIHLPLSVALIWLLIAHVVGALLYA
ncbi:MAG: hypothetical protein ACKO38_12345 [Planctomycetota bacterium]